MLIKNEIPVLEYDTSSPEIIAPGHDLGELELPELCVFPFLGETVREYADGVGAKTVGEFETITKTYPIMTFRKDGTEICLCEAPLGAPAAVQLMDALIARGVKTVFSAGCCGVLTDIEENALLVPVRALRDEGTSYHYLPPSRWAATSADARAALERALEKRKLRYLECDTWTTDGFFRETRDMTEYRKSEGLVCVEMECAGLCACAEKRGARFAQLLFAGDTLADPGSHDPRDWGKASRTIALEICVEAAAIFKNEVLE